MSKPYTYNHVACFCFLEYQATKRDAYIKKKITITITLTTATTIKKQKKK